MNRSVGIKAAVLLLCSMLTAQPADTWAATKSINSVSVKVSSGIEPGSSLPDIEIGSGAGSKGVVWVTASDSKYHVSEAEWVDKGGKVAKAGDQPRMNVTLEPEDISEAYFLAAYKASAIKVNGGTFVSARRNGDSLVVTLRVKAVKGDYDPPEDAYWYEQNMGEARWVKPENTSGYYEVQLYRDGKSVDKVSTSAFRYNFYPYMTKAGDYTFKVRTIPGSDAGKSYGGRSDWLESGELQITDRYVSDGKGQQTKDSTIVRGTQEPAGWITDGSIWSYRYPHGGLCRGKWEQLDGLWYYFNMDGIMQTGWQLLGSNYFYLYPNGQMAVGWSLIDDKWYYFYTSEDTAEITGSMVSGGWKVIGPYYYYFNGDGSMYTGWLALNGKRYYLNTVNNSLLGALFTGWIKRDDNVYFADANGEILEGWYQIDGKWYYFYPDSGEMAVNTYIYGCYVDQEGIWRQ